MRAVPGSRRFPANPGDDIPEGIVMAWSIWDLDGTLCDDTHRRHFAREGAFAHYHSALGLDPLRRAEGELLRSWRLARAYHRVAIVSTRPEEYRVRTAQWLKDRGLWDFIDEIHLRPDGDLQPSTFIKADILRSRFLALPDRVVSFAVEDREDLADMYRGYGVPTMLSLPLRETESDEDG